MGRAFQSICSFFLVIMVVLPTTGLAQSHVDSTPASIETIEVDAEVEVTLATDNSPLIIEGDNSDFVEEPAEIPTSTVELPTETTPADVPRSGDVQDTDETVTETATDIPTTDATEVATQSVETPDVTITPDVALPTEVATDEPRPESEESPVRPVTGEPETPETEPDISVAKNPASLFVTPDRATPGSTIAVYGNYFAPGTTGTLTFAGQEVKVETDAGGSFIVDTLRVPFNATDGDRIEINVYVAGEEVTASITVFQEKPTELTLLPADGAPGSTTTISGTGFYPDGWVTILWGDYDLGLQLGYFPVDREGAFERSVVIPDEAAPGEYTIYALDQNGHVSEATFKVSRRDAKMAIDPSAGDAGDYIGVSGTGFVPGERVDIRWGSAEGPSLGYKNAGDTGVFSGAMRVPTYATVGPTQVFLTSDSAVASIEFQVMMAPSASMSISPDSGWIGDRINVQGFNFPPEQKVNIHWGSESGPIVGYKNAGPTGLFSGAITVPANGTGGETRIYLRSESDDSATASVPFTVIAPTMAISPSSGLPGARISVTGTNFKPNEKVNVRWGSANGTVLGYKNAGPTGVFSGAILVPANAAAGGTRIYLQSGSGTTSAAFTVTAPPKAKITLSYPTDVNLGHGQVITVIGTNYQPRELVIITWAGGAVVGRVTARDNGSFVGKITIPAYAYSGPNTITARGASSNFSAGARVIVAGNPVPNIVLSSEVGPGNSIVRFSGTGFKPGEVVDITFPGYPRIGYVTAGPTGAISGAIKIPGGGANGLLQYITFKGRSGGQSFDAQYMVTYNVSTVSISHSRVAGGTIISFTGTGYRPGTDAYINIDCLVSDRDTFHASTGGCGMLGRVKVSATGTISGRVTIPAYLHAGSYNVHAIGFGDIGYGRYGMTGHQGLAPIIVTTTPTAVVRLSRTSGPANHTIQATFSGFRSHEYVEFYDITGRVLLGAGNADIRGNLHPGTLGTRDGSGNMIREGIWIPANAPVGSYQIVARGDRSGTVVRVTYRVTGPAASHHILHEAVVMESSFRERPIGQ